VATLIPAILTRDPEEVYEKLRFLDSIPEIRELHLDFADGKLVPNKTILPGDLKYLDTRLRIDAHLMVCNPHHYFHDLEALGVKTVVIHFESFQSVHDLAVAVENAAAMEFECSIALNHHTDVSVLEQFKGKVKMATMLCVDPGYQGQPMLPDALDRIVEVRRRYPDMIIEADGGVRLENIESLVGHGADRIVVGSGIWHSAKPLEKIKSFLDKL